MDNISGVCKQEMEIALDTQAELSPKCKSEIQKSLLKINPNINVKTGKIESYNTGSGKLHEMKPPPGYDPNIKPPLPQKPAKIDREIRRVQREKKREEDDKKNFAMKVFYSIIGILIVITYFIKPIINVTTRFLNYIMQKLGINFTIGSIGTSTSNGNGNGVGKNSISISESDWMDSPSTSSNNNNKEKGKKKKH